MTDNHDELHVIVLAAGDSTRFGSPKQLALIGGHPMLRASVNKAVDVVGARVVVVLGAYVTELTALLESSPAAVAINPRWHEGMATSIHAGLAQVPKSCTAVLLMVADQPAVTAEDLRRLVSDWRCQPESIAASAYGTTLGVPAIFPRSCFDALHNLRGDIGARALLQQNIGRVIRVPMPSAAIEVDTPEDLLRL